MKTLRLLLPIFLFFTFVNTLHADVKLGIIDANKIGEESIAFKNVIGKIKSKMEELDKNAMKIQKEFARRYQALEKQKNVLSADEYNKKSNVLNTEAMKEDKILYGQRTNLEKAYKKANAALSEKVKEIIEKISQKKGITIVFDKSSTIYSNTSIDVTEEVLSEVNKQLKSIDVNLS